jgi:hypothetical protein
VEKISDPSADKARRNKMEKHINRNNIPAIGEIQRKSRENPEEELHSLVTVSLSGGRFAFFRFASCAS